MSIHFIFIVFFSFSLVFLSLSGGLLPFSFRFRTPRLACIFANCKELTGSIDHETDQILQRTIREEFKDCTVLTIAHRIHTIVDSDRVLVLENGEVKEFGRPQSLLANSSSAFARLVSAGGSAERKEEC